MGCEASEEMMENTLQYIKTRQHTGMQKCGKKWKMDINVQHGRENVNIDSVKGSGICVSQYLQIFCHHLCQCQCILNICLHFSNS